jgi:hypothetical protein
MRAYRVQAQNSKYGGMMGGVKLLEKNGGKSVGWKAT